MNIFDSLKDIFAGGVDLPVIGDIQDQITQVTDGATEALGGATEVGQTVVDDITQKLGL
jgi:nitrogenase subunit NifH